MRPPFNYYMGKQLLAKHILPLLPPHRIYTEAFAGGATLFFAKTPAKIEVINDLNDNLVNFYRVCQHPASFAALARMVKATLYSQFEYGRAQRILKQPLLYSPLRRAWAVWAAHNMALFANPENCMLIDRQRSRAGLLGMKRAAFNEKLCQRLEGVLIEKKDALKVIKNLDAPDALHFADPPYFNAQTGANGYSEADFIALLELLSGIKGKFVLTCYDCACAREFAAAGGWQVKEIDKKIAMSTAKSKPMRKELAICNFNSFSGADFVLAQA